MKQEISQEFINSSINYHSINQSSIIVNIPGEDQQIAYNMINISSLRLNILPMTK